eukprot:COSAG06_NODE_15986_length_1031_cov_0.589056_2_plen_68_part_01
MQYLIVRSLFDAERVAGLLELSEGCLRQWKECNPETGQPGAAQPAAREAYVSLSACSGCAGAPCSTWC